MLGGIGSESERPPDVTRHHGQEGADARGDRITHAAPAGLWDLWLGHGRSRQHADPLDPADGRGAIRLKEQLAQLWTYTYEGAARRCLTTWLPALRWPRLPAFQKLGRMLTRHLDGILSYCHEKVPFGTVEAINGNIRAMLRRGRGYRDHEYLLLKVQKATATRRLRRTA